MLSGALLFSHQTRQMLGVLDLLAAVPSPYVSCNDLVFLGDPNGVEVGENGQRAPRNPVAST